MNAKDAHPLSDLRWHRLSATVMNIRSLPAMSAHPFSVFQAIMKGVSLLPVSPSAAALLPNKESPAASACPRPAPAPLMGNESPELTGDLSPVPGEERTGGGRKETPNRYPGRRRLPGKPNTVKRTVSLPGARKGKKPVNH